MKEELNDEVISKKKKKEEEKVAENGVIVVIMNTVEPRSRNWKTISNDKFYGR